MYLQRLADLREDKDLLKKEVAGVLGISRRVYSRYERGLQSMPLLYLIKLADFYHTSADYILGRTNDPTFYEKKR